MSAIETPTVEVHGLWHGGVILTTEHGLSWMIRRGIFTYPFATEDMHLLDTDTLDSIRGALHMGQLASLDDCYYCARGGREMPAIRTDSDGYGTCGTHTEVES